jgi:hypothetical protein
MRKGKDHYPTQQGVTSNELYPGRADMAVQLGVMSQLRSDSEPVSRLDTCA